MKKINILLALVFLGSSAIAQKKDFNIKQIFPIEASHSYVGFSVKYMGYAQVKGRFENFAGSILYDEADITKTSVSFSLEVGSIDTDLEWRDKDLKSETGLMQKSTPELLFTANQQKKLLMDS